MKKTKSIVLLIFCVAFLIFGGVTRVFAAPFQNGDFETGDFTGWSGALDTGGIVFDVNPDLDDHFTVTSGIATITNDYTYWIANLFQTFTLDPLNGPGWTMDN